jgi:hypothetical protein
MKVIKNYIDSGEEFDFHKVDVEFIINILDDEQRLGTESKYYLAADDDNIVYFLIEKDDCECEEYMMSELMSDYGCTIFYYWSANNRAWCGV